ncbi:DNA mismatch repair protein MutS domain protein [Candidatus Sulfopaludibacter sp. SbA4]|nr:DNA mismatch repair protein MutS domain protein [Candidatus Sulfopaludibacter sp. SbA4]
MTSATVLLGYQQRIDQIEALLAHLQMRQGTTVAVLVLAVVTTAAFCFLAFSRRAMPIWYPPLPLSAALISLRKYTRQQLQISRFIRLRRFYAGGVERLEERWVGNGISGQEFEVPDHVYAADLSLFGHGSLFERLCTARTHLGCERLASYLQEPARFAEIRQRQAAVRELTGRTDLREKVALLGRYDFEQSRWQTFAEWLDSPPAGFASWLGPAALASSVVVGALSAAIMLKPSIWPALLPIILPIAVSNAVAGLSLRKRVRRVLKASAPVASEITIIREGLELLAGERFVTPKLVTLTTRAAPAGAVIRLLKPWFMILRERTKDWFYLPSLWLLLGTQSALAIESWRLRYRGSLRQWLDAWAEFEALNSLACYAHENPEDSWAELDDKSAHFSAEGLGHPLMARDTCVRNDVSLGDAYGFCVLSGSNMSGKSTLLRSIGLAAVLAFAGAPVRARSLRLAVMRIGASISVVDSLRDGKSKFLGEVQRLREMLQLSADGPVLFLVDEIFSGTNSPDRRAAADAVARTLAARGAIGVISTRDIALAAIAAHGGTNLHMRSRDGADNPLDFDYRLKPGVTTESNALAIARMVGVPI